MKSGNNIFCISIVTCAPATKEFSPLPDGISSRKNPSRRVYTVVPRDVTIIMKKVPKMFSSMYI